MTSVFPVVVETVVLPLPEREVRTRLNKAIEINRLAGDWSENHFQFHVRMIRPSPFLPVIKGVAEPTRTGCILFTHYHLLPAIKMFLGFWIVMLTAIAAYLSITRQQPLWILGAGLVILVGRWIVASNLKLQHQVSRKVLLQILED